MRKEILVGMKREWKGFCQRMFQLNDNWSRHSPLDLAHYPSAGVKPVCIRVNEKEGLLISLKDVRGEDPGLVVIDMVDGKVLWKQTWVFPSEFNTDNRNALTLRMLLKPM
ncbi:hypothetical protein PM082_022120 [Marasmius tenuissimus]|nr:hypothetical protein PM082_022120 [Marasmius tenuissimus]